MRSQSEPISIVGAGIAGLTAALALAQRGFAVGLYEMRPDLPTYGAGIQIPPNAHHILQRLGIDLNAKLFEPDSIDMRNNNGKLLSRLPVAGHFGERFGASYGVISRADLAHALYVACKRQPDIQIDFDSDVGGRSGLSSSVVVGAEGIWSTLRSDIVGARKPVSSGYQAIRGMIPSTSLPDSISQEFRQSQSVSLYLGRGCHGVFYPAGNGINMVLINRAENMQKKWSLPVSSETVREALTKICPALTALADSDCEFKKWPIFAVDPTGIWHNNDTVLIGDAAHAMEPFAAQGGAMAIEDAYVLADCLAGHANNMEAFEKYRENRLKRILQVKSRSMRNGQIYHLSGPAALARNVAMKAISANALVEQLSWIYSWKPDQD